MDIASLSEPRKLEDIALQHVRFQHGSVCQQEAASKNLEATSMSLIDEAHGLLPLAQSTLSVRLKSRILACNVDALEIAVERMLARMQRDSQMEKERREQVELHGQCFSECSSQAKSAVNEETR